MYSAFEELNWFVYWSLHGIVLDALIWCLGPYVDDERDYGLARICLAVATRKTVRVWFRLTR